MKNFIIGFLISLVLITTTSCEYRGFTEGTVCDKYYTEEFSKQNDDSIEFHPKSYYITIMGSGRSTTRTFRVSEIDYIKYDIGDYFDYRKEG